MQNFFNNSSAYPQPIQLDEETGEIRTQNYEETFLSNNQQPSDQNFSTTQNEFSNPQPTSQTNSQSSINGMEKIFSMLKSGGAANDMLSALLMKNGSGQNPLMSQALSTMLGSTKKGNSNNIAEKRQTPTTFEEM